MRIIPFDIKFRSEIQSEENGYKGRYKVQTREGKPVRIICWDRKDCEHPIIALVECYSIEVSLSYRKNGTYRTTSACDKDDLVLIDTLAPMFRRWDRIKSKVDGTVFDIVAIDFVSHKYEVISDNTSTDRHYVAYYEQNDFELVKPVSGFNYLKGIVMRCAEGPNKGSLWLRCRDNFVKSDGVTFSSEGLYYSANKKEADKFFAELDKSGYKWSSILECIIKKPKFKIGDRVRYKNGDGVVYTIGNVLESSYQVIRSNQSDGLMLFEEDDHLELAPELTDFEKELADCFCKSIIVRNVETLAKECAPKLIELAKKEIIKKLNED